MSFMVIVDYICFKYGNQIKKFFMNSDKVTPGVNAINVILLCINQDSCQNYNLLILRWYSVYKIKNSKIQFRIEL